MIKRFILLGIIPFLVALSSESAAQETKNKNVECYKAERNQLFKHYLNHKGTDIKNGRSNSSDNTVIESIIHRFHKKSYQANADFINDIRSEAHAIVW